MTPHDHATFTPGCYRCELGRDEAMSALVDERDELEAEVQRLRDALDVALDALRRSADDHGCDYCRADVASVERALGLDAASDEGCRG